MHKFARKFVSGEVGSTERWLPIVELLSTLCRDNRDFRDCQHTIFPCRHKSELILNQKKVLEA